MHRSTHVRMQRDNNAPSDGEGARRRFARPGEFHASPKYPPNVVWQNYFKRGKIQTFLKKQDGTRVYRKNACQRPGIRLCWLQIIPVPE